MKSVSYVVVGYIGEPGFSDTDSLEVLGTRASSEKFTSSGINSDISGIWSYKKLR